MNNFILKDTESAKYIYAAKKNFILKDTVSESHTKVLIGHMSDMHADITCFEYAMKCFEYFGVDFAVHTGDTVKNNLSNGYSYFNDGIKNAKFPVYNTIGNHETFSERGKEKNEYIHKELLSHLENIKSEDNRGYYYVDFDEYKLRLVAINDYDCDDEKMPEKRAAYILLQKQCDWLVKTLKDAAEKDYAVIIAAHESDIPLPADDNKYGFCQRFSPHPWGPTAERPHVVASIVDAFKHAKNVKIDLKWYDTEIGIHIDETFTKKGEFICYLNGHRHGDFIGYLPIFKDQLTICMPCSGCYPADFHNIGEEISDLPRIPGTVTEDCLNFYSIDRVKKTISIVRMGATVNDLMEERRAVVLKYEGE